MHYDYAVTRRLAEVAKYVGVSEATVSRVLNGKPGISEATRTAVLTALDVLGYERPTKLRAEHEHYYRMRERGLPVVLVNAAIDDLGFACVATDDGHAVEQAYNHLSSLGHRAIGLVLGPGDHVPSHRKQVAFEALAGDATGLVERTIFSMEGGQSAATRLVKRGATGLVCASDVLALGAMRAVRRLGLSVPADVSVVGFDDSAFMNCTDPPLTTVRQPIDAMGHAAVALLASQIGGNEGPTEEMLFEPELVVRGPTGPIGARDSGSRRTGRSAARVSARG